MQGGEDGVEIIVVNDGSTDRTEEIVRSLQGGPIPVRLINKPNGGPGAGSARNAGVPEAKGDWLWLVDSDDLALPGAVSEILAEIKAHPDTDLFIYPLQWTYEDPSKNFVDIPIPPPVTETDGKTVLRKNYAPAYCNHRFIFRRSLTEDPGLRNPEQCKHEDEYFGFALLYLAGKTRMMDHFIYLYLQHPESCMGTMNVTSAKSYITLCETMGAFVDSDSVAPEDKDWVNGIVASWIIKYMKYIRGYEGYRETVRPLLPAVWKIYRSRCGSLPLHTRIRDYIRILRARFR